MIALAVKGCEFEDKVHGGTCTIQPDGFSKKVKVDGKEVLLDGCKVIVANGTKPGAQVAPITITISAAMITKLKIEDKLPIGDGDMSDGTDTAKYQVGQSVQEQPVTITLKSTGQEKVKGV